MKSLVLLFALGASLLAACGGGDGGNAPPPMSDAAASATTLVYSQTATSAGNAPLVFPGFTCLSPQTVRTERSNASISQSVAANQTFNGQGGLTAVTSSISLQSCADGSEPATETDYFTIANSGEVTDISLVGAVVTYASYFGSARTVQVVYPSPGLIVAQKPMPSTHTWTSSAQRTLTWSGQNDQETLAVNADGSYTDESVRQGGIFPYEAVTTVQHSDASGTQTEVAGANASAPPYTVSLSAPQGGTVTVSTSGTPPVDPVLPTPTACHPSPGSPCPVVGATPYPRFAWYPYYPSASHPLETITTTDKGTVAVPKDCNVASTFASSARLIETVDATLDIWSGTVNELSDAYIDPSVGILCEKVSVQSASYALDPTSADTTPTGTTTLTVTESLQNETGPPALFAVPALAHFAALLR